MKVLLLNAIYRHSIHQLYNAGNAFSDKIKKQYLNALLSNISRNIIEYKKNLDWSIIYKFAKWKFILQ